MDSFKVSIDFKLSRNYQSLGGSVTYKSDVKNGESLDEAFKRVYDEANTRIEVILNDASNTISILKEKK